MTFYEIKSILKNKTVGIAGAGGLGSNCAAALVRAGVGHIIVADFDKIEKDNLNRQFYFYNQIGRDKVNALRDNLHAINPEVKITALKMKLRSCDIYEIFKNCDIIIEAFDSANAKQMIIETTAEELPDKILIAGMGIAGYGDNNNIKTQKYGKLYICGDQKNEISKICPPIAPRVGIVANMQANTAIDILLKFCC